MSLFDLLSIGHSNVPAERFVAMLRGAGVTAIADVRSKPVSRFFPWFSAKALAARLEQNGIGYQSYGGSLGGRPRDAKLYCDGVADYEAMARRPEFQAGLDALMAEAARHRICLMCAEREPLDCHRCLLVARSLDQRGLAVGHILHEGAIESHRITEQRLLALSGEGDDLFLTGQGGRLAAAYRCRARAVAYRAPGAKGANLAAEKK
jgi:uncharacterized protein (DUF488 family)